MADCGAETAQLEQNKNHRASPRQPGHLEVEDALFRVEVVRNLQELFDQFDYYIPRLVSSSPKCRAQAQLVRNLAKQLLGEDFEFELRPDDF